MKTRMEKYYDEENTNLLLRSQKNEKLYENISDVEVEDYRLDNNETILGNNPQNIDVEQIKKILDTKYNKEPKRRSIILEEEPEEAIISLDETREYDINAILEKARNEKEVDYDKERVKKIRDTQYDILNSLELDKDKKEEVIERTPVIEKKENDELAELINTITMRELNCQNEEDLNPLDILTDLKGNDDTVIIGGVHEEESVNETSPIISLEEADKIKPLIKEETKTDLSNTLAFTQSDFDDFNDLKKEVKSSRALIYVIIVLVSLVLIAGLVIFLNKFLNMQLF